MDITPAKLSGTDLGVNQSASTPSVAMSQRRALIDAVRAVNATGFWGQDNELTYVLDRVSHEAIARVINRKTNEVVMQVPAEYILRLAEELKQHS